MSHEEHIPASLSDVFPGCKVQRWQPRPVALTGKAAAAYVYLAEQLERGRDFVTFAEVRMGLHIVAIFVANLFKSRGRLEAENVLLRHQLNMALRRGPARLRLTSTDRTILVWMVRLWPNLLNAVQVVKPDTVLRWHRAGFKAFWRRKSRKRAGRPKIDRGLREMANSRRRWLRHAHNVG